MSPANARTTGLAAAAAAEDPSVVAEVARVRRAPARAVDWDVGALDVGVLDVEVLDGSAPVAPGAARSPAAELQPVIASSRPSPRATARRGAVVTPTGARRSSGVLLGMVLLCPTSASKGAEPLPQVPQKVR